MSAVNFFSGLDSLREILFEKVKIPETKANIKKITVYLGDQQVAAVVRGKISKKNLEVASETQTEIEETEQ